MVGLAKTESNIAFKFIDSHREWDSLEQLQLQNSKNQSRRYLFSVENDQVAFF